MTGPPVGMRRSAPRLLMEKEAAPQITTREIQLIFGMARGRTLSQISMDLHLGQSTVKTHCNNIFTKTRCRTQAELVSWAYRNGYMQGLKPEGRPALEFTPREMSVLQYCVLGLDNAAIGTRLVITENSVKTYMSRLRTKMMAYNRAHVAALAWQLGIVKLEWWEDLGVAQQPALRLYVPASADYNGPYRCCPSCGTRTMPRDPVKTGWIQDAMW